MAIYRGPGGAGDATNDATVTQVQEYASQAASSASSASTSATNAATSASAASTSATNAANSASSASSSASSAASSVSSASTQASNAATSATAAANSATAAANSANNASASASDAASSAVTAETYADSAQTQASNALNYSNTATTAVNNALSLYGSAAELNNAVSAAQLAETNALGHSNTAEDFAIDAANSASDALSNANAAQGYSSTASSYASAASVSASNAAASATTATTQANLAAYYASNTGSIYGSLAAVQAAATSASTSASTATTQATNAATSATQAAASAASASAVSLANEPTRHSVRPSLLLDFANTKTLDPRVTFTRASTATYYDGKTVAKAEENLILQSQDFATTWTTSNLTVTANTTTAPDGTTTADSIIPTTAASTSHRVIQSVTLIATPYVFSVYVKANGYTKVGIREVSVAGYYASFNLTAVTVLDSSLCTGSIVDAGNGWYRVTLSFTGVAGVNIWSIYPLDAAYTTGSPTAYPFTADGTSGLFVWGAQLEQRSSVTAYTATTTAPITNYIPALQTAAANIARFEHNPVTRESLGLEIEEQRTNLLTYSDDFSNVIWVKTASSISSNVAIAPDGTLTADKYIPNTGSATNLIEEAFTSTAQAYTFTCYVKASGSQFVQLLWGSSQSTNYANFDVINGTVGTTVATSTGITPVGNGWFRISITSTLAAFAGKVYISVVASSTAARGSSYTGNGFDGVLVWGAQLEAGSFATSYIPTVASQVTRSADSATMTGTNFSSWYRADETSVYIEATPLDPDDNGGSDTLSNQIVLFGSAQPNTSLSLNKFDTSTRVDKLVIAWRKLAGTVARSCETANNAFSPTVSTKIAIALKTGDQALSYQGNSVLTGTGTDIPLDLLSSLSLMFGISGTVRKFAYYPKRLTNSELQDLTTV